MEVDVGVPYAGGEFDGRGGVGVVGGEGYGQLVGLGLVDCGGGTG